MTSTDEPVTSNHPERRADFGLLAVTVMAALGLVLGFVSLALDDDATSGPPVGTAATSATISLSEFALSPDAVTIGAGGSVAVTNEGTQLHNIRVAGTDLITPDLAGGEMARLDLSSLDPGEYELFCEIAGHKDVGMVGSLIVDGVGSAVTADGSDGHGTDYAAMDVAMTESMLAFPAATEGRGNVPLEPTFEPDGTKRFELTAAITSWEVEPGKFVDAWTYNGMVPGPWIKIEVGDKVAIHLQNDLPMGTDIHWHGIRTPNAMDGVAPFTQDLIEAGEDFLYEFTAERPAVGMYHAHHAGQMQVPNGLLGVFQIGDLQLPRGRTISGTTIPADLTVAHEIPMVLNDAGAIGLSLDGKSFPATEPYAVNEGDWLLVHYFNEGFQAHPMHQHQFPQLVVAKDGIPLDSPYFADTVNVAPGERYSVLIHADDVGTWVWHCHILNHVERADGMFGMVTALVVS